MGHPKMQKRTYERPGKPYEKVRLEEEKKLVQRYGLRRKKEIWKAASIVRSLRRRARHLQAYKDKKAEKELLGKLVKIGVINASMGLDDVLGLNVNSILERRLQTLICKQNLANTPKHGRQLITHGHVSIMGKRIAYPGYIVSKEEEPLIIVSSKIGKAKSFNKNIKEDNIKAEENAEKGEKNV